MSSTPDRYPRTVTCGGSTIRIARMVPGDAPAVHALVAALPAHDLLFLNRDLTHPKVVGAWMDALCEGSVASLGAWKDGELVGCTAIVVEPTPWQRHVGELRVLLLPALRGMGVGQVLVQECFALALGLGLEKLCVRMTIDQHAALAAFESLGFRAEGVLRGHVRDGDGALHDLVLLGHDIAAAHSLLQLYGVADTPEPVEGT
jgi:RimJ/RimL family protein N-acetyltransferase